MCAAAMLPFAKLLWTLVFASVMSAGQAADVSVQSASDETAKHVTGNSHDDVTVDDDGDDDDEVVASRDHRVSMATADASSASSSASFPLLAATVELPSPPAAARSE